MKADHKTGSGFLAAGGVAAVLASTCCLGPLILVMLSFTGAWIGNLSVLEPYRPLFLTVAIVRRSLRRREDEPNYHHEIDSSSRFPVSAR